jgi:hypothetical protein
MSLYEEEPELPFELRVTPRPGGSTINIKLKVHDEIIDCVKSTIHDAIMKMSEEEREAVLVTIGFTGDISMLWSQGEALPFWDHRNSSVLQLAYGSHAARMYHAPDNFHSIAMAFFANPYVLCVKRQYEIREKTEDGTLSEQMVMFGLPSANLDRTSNGCLGVLSNLFWHVVEKEKWDEKMHPPQFSFCGGVYQMMSESDAVMGPNIIGSVFRMTNMDYKWTVHAMEQYPVYHTVEEAKYGGDKLNSFVWIDYVDVLKDARRNCTLSLFSCASHLMNPNSTLQITKDNKIIL